MTTLSLLPGPLKRLFSRIDAAGTTERPLEMALDHWRIKRGDRLYPSLSDIDVGELGAFATHVFVFERKGKTDWSLRFAGEAAKPMLRAEGGEATLSTLANRRIAARLRLLFGWTVETGEAISAGFTSPEQSGEILVAPLSTDGKEVRAIFGGLVARP
jgi:hypothetical protein